MKSIPLTASTWSQLIPVSLELFEDTDWFARYVASRHKSRSEQSHNPFEILGIILISFSDLYPLVVSDNDVNLVLQRGGKHKNLIFTNRFHTAITPGTIQHLPFKHKNGMFKGRTYTDYYTV